MSKFLIITGGSRGIGKATIEKFLDNDWKIINISRSNCDIKSVINFNIDLSSSAWSTQYSHELVKAVAGASKIALVHNASIFNRDDIKSLDEQDFRNTLEFNLVSPLTLNKIFLPLMPAGSSIIYIGSTLSEIGVANRASYVITKHAMVGMMRATCQDLSGTGISTCCICPGFMNTSMLTDQVEKPILDQIIKNKVTAGRLIEPAEIANFIYFCAENPVINGSILHANLGHIEN